MAKGYLVATLDLTNPDAYGPYRDQVPAIIDRHGGRYLVRGGGNGSADHESPPRMEQALLTQISALRNKHPSRLISRPCPVRA